MSFLAPVRAEEWRHLRETYRYVPAVLRLVDSDAGEGCFAFGDAWLAPDLPAHDEWSDAGMRRRYSSVDVDAYHTKLLLSDNDIDVLHGVLSVVFWGFASGSDGRFRTMRAVARAKQFLTGRSLRNGSRLHPTPAPELISAIRSARSELARNQVGKALTTIMAIRFLGMSFASKVLMYMDPSKAAVYDAVVYSKLAHGHILPGGVVVNPTPIGSVRRKAAAYEAWCMFCAEAAAGLNGSGARWADWDGSEHRWRAVDIERAIFAMPER